MVANTQELKQGGLPPHYEEPLPEEILEEPLKARVIRPPLRYLEPKWLR